MPTYLYYAHTHTHTHTHTCARTMRLLLAHPSAAVIIYTYIHTYIYMHTYIHINIYIIHTHTHTHKHTPSQQRRDRQRKHSSHPSHHDSFFLFSAAPQSSSRRPLVRRARCAWDAGFAGEELGGWQRWCCGDLGERHLYCMYRYTDILVY